MDKWVVAYTDGASRGNPGESGIGVVIFDGGGEVLKEMNQFIGIATNNLAEYKAVDLALTEVKSLGIDKVEIRTDSKLLCSQLTGEYRIKDPKLVKAAIKCMRLLRKFREWKVTLIPREKNRKADSLAQAAIDEKRGQAG